MKKIALFLFVTSTSFLMAGSHGGCGCNKKSESTPAAKKDNTCVGNKCPEQAKPAEKPVQAVNPVSNPES